MPSSGPSRARRSYRKPVIATPSHGCCSRPWTSPLPGAWERRVNAPETEAELEARRQSVARGQPFGDGLEIGVQADSVVRLDLAGCGEGQGGHAEITRDQRQPGVASRLATRH